MTNTPEVEMLTIRECAGLLKGISEYTIRQLVVHEQIPYIKVGESERGKILINKSELFKYFHISTKNTKSLDIQRFTM